MLHGIIASSITGQLKPYEIPEDGFKFWRLAFVGGPKNAGDYIMLSRTHFKETFFGAPIDVSGVLATTNSLYSNAFNPALTLTDDPQQEYCSVASPGKGVWITYEFPVPRLFKRIDIWGGGANVTSSNGRMPASITVLGSVDGTNWVEVWGERIVPPLNSYVSRWLFSDKDKPAYDGTPHKYWRLKYTDTLGSYMYLREIIRYDLNGAIQKNTGVIATASSEYGSSYGPANVLTNGSAYWSSIINPPIDTQWLQLTLPEPQAIAQFNLNFGSGGGAGRNTGLPYIYVEASDDGVTWSKVHLIVDDFANASANIPYPYPLKFTDDAPVPTIVSRMQKFMIIEVKNPLSEVSRMQKLIIINKKVP